VIEKTDGAGAFEGALRWALHIPRPVLLRDGGDGGDGATPSRGRDGATPARSQPS